MPQLQSWRQPFITKRKLLQWTVVGWSYHKPWTLNVLHSSDTPHWWSYKRLRRYSKFCVTYPLKCRGITVSQRIHRYTLMRLKIQRGPTASIGSVSQSPRVLSVTPLQRTIYILYTVVNNKQYAVWNERKSEFRSTDIPLAVQCQTLENTKATGTYTGRIEMPAQRLWCAFASG